MSKEKPKLVYIVSRFPFPLEKGDKLRAYYQIKELSQNYDIYLIALSDKKVNHQQINELKPFCKEIHIHFLPFWSIAMNLLLCIFNQKPFQIGYFFSYRHATRIEAILRNIKPDHIFCQLIRVSEYVKNYHHCKKTLDYMDALSIGMHRRSKESKGLKRILFNSEYRRLLKYERTIFEYFEHKTIISKQDQAFIIHPDYKKIHIIPNGIDATFFEIKPHQKKYDIVFVGNMSYAPNVTAAKYIAEQILPFLPTVNCLIAGANPSKEILKLATKNPRQITVSGWMNDIRDAYQSGKVFFAPMQSGTGMQNKLLEAMAQEIPCITTSIANNGIEAKHQEIILVADDQKQMIDTLQELLENDSLQKEMRTKAKNWVFVHFSWKETVQRLKQIMMD